MVNKFSDCQNLVQNLVQNFKSSKEKFESF